MTIDYNPHEITDKECECGCHNLMPLGLIRNGWKHLRGHKPLDTTIKPKKHPKGVINNTGPEQILAYFAAQIEQLKANKATLMDDAQQLLAEGKRKMALATEIEDQIRQLQTVKAQTQEALSRVFKQKETVTK